MTAAEFQQKYGSKGNESTRKAKGTTANALTKYVLLRIGKDWDAWRQNNHATFDIARAAKTVFNLLLSGVRKKSVPDIIKILRTCYNRFQGKEGLPDIVGQGKSNRSNAGLWISVEVKVGKDTLKPAQRLFIKQTNTRGGVGLVARSIEQFDKDYKSAMAKFDN